MPRAEAFGDFEALMASCSREMQSYAGDDGAAADWQATSFEELRSCYRSLIEANIYLIHMDVEKLLVSDDEVVVAGVAHQLYRGDSLSRFGIKAADPEGVYQLTKRVLIIVAFDERGKAGGEKAYLNGPVTASDFSQVPQELIPEQFWHNPLTGEIPRQSERAVLTQSGYSRILRQAIYVHSGGINVDKKPRYAGAYYSLRSFRFACL
jgi:hypothetical protein